MMKYRIVSSRPDGVGGAYKAQKLREYSIFGLIKWSSWEDISEWLWSPEDAKKYIEEDKGDIVRTIKYFE